MPSITDPPVTVRRDLLEIDAKWISMIAPVVLVTTAEPAWINRSLTCANVHPVSAVFSAR